MNRRQILASTGAVASLGLCAGIVAGAPGCTPAPAAEPVGPGLAFAIERHRAALTDLKAACRLVDACETAEQVLSTPETVAALEAAEEASYVDCEREAQARLRLMAEPVRTMADVRAKAAYIVENGRHFALAHDPEMAALLASMGASADNLSAVSAEPDPMLAKIRQCRAALAIANSKHTDAEVNAAMKPIAALYDELESCTPPVTTARGALEALRFAHEAIGHTQEDFIEPVVGAVLAFFEGRA